MNEAVQKLLEERYYLDNENTWENIANRVGAIYPPITDYIKNMYFIPSTPTLMNGNTDGKRKGTLSSCFIMGLEDSISGIADAIKETMLVTKASGGVGHTYSNLRANGETIKSISRPSSGPLPFMRMFNSVLDGVSQGGARKGAGMAQFDIYHGNIVDVILAKSKENHNLDRLNISLRIDDEFYYNLKHNPDSLFFCNSVTDNNIHWTVNYNNKELTYKDLWDLIIDSAWKTGDPGIFNSDIAFRQCTTTNLDSHVSSNPCQPEFATVLTPKGIKTIGEVNIGDKIWSGKQFTTIVNKWSTGVKSVYSYNTSVGSFIGTENHKIFQNGSRIEVKDAETIDRCDVSLDFSHDNLYILNLQDVMDGLVIGDGSIHKASNNLIYLCIGENDQDYFKSEINSLILKDRTKAFKYGWEIKTTITENELDNISKRVIPERFYKGDRRKVISFLRGLYSANGSICSNRVTLKQTSLTLIKQVQEMLSFIGISSYYTTNKSCETKFSNGTYACKESYDLNITFDRDKFYNLIGFIQKYKTDKLQEIVKNTKPRNYIKTSYEIQSIDYLGEFEVFDLTVVAEEHSYWTGGLRVSNCAEYTGIPYSSCNLGSLNATKFVKADGTFDWSLFQQVTRLAIRFLDKIIDVNDYPIEKIADTTRKIRPIGLGCFGIAHALYMMKIPYNSIEGLEFFDALSYELTMTALDESISMAKETEPYPAFDYDLFIKANERFFDQLTDLKVRDGYLADLKKHGIRNSCLTSFAPNGTISFIAGMLSGGIEPVYALAYSRKIEKENKTYEVVYIVDPIFEQYLNENYDEETKIKILEKVVKNNGSCQTIEEIPEQDRKVFITAHDLTPDEHLEVLGIVARNTSLSVSKTINLPKTATKEDISNIYIKAHELGIIGVTVK